MKVKTSELIGPALDWAVAKALGAVFKEDSIGCIIAVLDGKWLGGFKTKKEYGCALPNPVYYPSTSWLHGGPILERLILEGLLVQRANTNIPQCRATLTSWDPIFYGPTPLIAAMRCYVASKLGDEIEIQEELLK